MGVVHSSRGTLDPASPQLLSETAIVARLASATLKPHASIDWDTIASSYAVIRDHIARVIPGFEDFNERVQSKDGFTLPHAVRDQREFRTQSGKAQFTVHAIPRRVLADGEFLMTTIRSHDQFNTTIYGMDDRYRGVRSGRRVVFVNCADIEAAGLEAGSAVDIVGHHGGVERRAKNFRLVPYEIPRGCIATYFPEANVLVPIDDFAVGSLTPASKSVVVSIERARG